MEVFEGGYLRGGILREGIFYGRYLRGYFSHPFEGGNLANITNFANICTGLQMSYPS